MNVYEVTSEVLTSRTHYDVCGEPCDPPEDYAIYQLVVAKNRSQAKWLAWKTDRESFENDPREMPKFSVKLKMKDYPGCPRIVTDEPEMEGILYGRDDLTGEIHGQKASCEPWTSLPGRVR